MKCDIRKFFDSVDQEILLEIIKKKIVDKNTLRLIEIIIKSFPAGLPLGNVTSQLFANIYLNELDQFVKHGLKEKRYLRYCDDFIILGEREEHLRSIITGINNFLKEKLKLNLHPDKVIVRKYSQGIDFLGYVVLPHHKVLRTKTKKRLFRNIKIRKKDLKHGAIGKEAFNQSLQSYYGILKHCNGHKLREEINRFIDQ